VLAGVEDAALFRSVDGGRSWAELPGLRGHDSGSSWQPGAGGMCLHTILVDPRDDARMHVAISAAGVFRTEDGGKSWQPANRGLVSGGIPDGTAEVGHCVHHDHATLRRRPFVRFFACEQDLSHEPSDAPLPAAVASGVEPFLVVGAMAGG
jgi:hypothetical protein